MRIPRLPLSIITVAMMLAACTSAEPAAFIPAGDSPPIPMAASAELVGKTAEIIEAPPPASGDDTPLPDDPVEAGRIVSERNACNACHSLDGSKLVGPTWKGLFGRTESMSDGTTLVVDDAYLAESIRDPKAKIVLGYDDAMTEFNFLSDEEINALIAYIKTIE